MPLKASPITFPIEGGNVTLSMLSILSNALGTIVITESGITTSIAPTLSLFPSNLYKTFPSALIWKPFSEIVIPSKSKIRYHFLYKSVFFIIGIFIMNCVVQFISLYQYESVLIFSPGGTILFSSGNFAVSIIELYGTCIA